VQVSGCIRPVVRNGQCESVILLFTKGIILKCLVIYLSSSYRNGYPEGCKTFGADCTQTVQGY